MGSVLPHMATSGQAHPLRVVSRLLVESPPPDALPGYYCMHVITVVEGSSPVVIAYEFKGLAAHGVTQMTRLFSGGDVYLTPADKSLYRKILKTIRLNVILPTFQ